MTASNPPRDESRIRIRPGGRPFPGGHLDSTAQLMNRISSQLGSQLGLVSLDGTRRPAPPALVLVGHGSRDPRALSTIRTLMDRIRELRPGLPVHLGHIELNEPLLPDTLAGLGTGDAVLVPLLLSRGYHVKQDIPEAAAASSARIRIAAPLGPHPLLVETLYERLVEAGWHTRPSGPGGLSGVGHLGGSGFGSGDAERRASGVVLAAAGSRDPDAAADTRRTAELLAERLGVPVVPAYASAAAPTVAHAVRALAARGRHRIAVASYFTAPGRFSAECAAAAPWIAAAPLGAHPSMARLVLHRYDQASATQAVTRPTLAAAG
ncbi:sirohydrochlorin chelatase [Streptomyces sp. NPDC048484]|uniref:sirohydrochlorin chelatase n=1 Tax=Streptomyces sp. NPDC048484 TaxID=3155146 RepID=UPI003436F0DC